MSSNDRLNRIYSEELKLRIYTAETLDTVRNITGVHNTTPNATWALSRCITAAALLSAGLKPDSNQSVSIKFHGGGPIKQIHVQADARGNIRGYTANPSIDLNSDIGEISFSKAIGPGMLTVTKDLEMKNPYSGVVPLRTGEVASEIAWYLTDSEQTPSAVIIALDLDENGSITSSAGILIQTLPDTDDAVLEKIENNIANMERPLGEILNRGGTVLDAVKSILGTEDYEIFSSLPLKANCRCSRELLFSVISDIDIKDITAMAEEDKGARVFCTFCAKEYNFTQDELRKIVEAKS